MKKIFFIPVLALLLSSCTKEATIKLPEPENKLVVTCFITPDNNGYRITAVVRLSAPKFSGSSSQSYAGDITDASVLLNDGSQSLSFAYDINSNCYLANSDYPIVSGKTYYLTVTTPDGKYANASTTVPYGHLTIDKFDVNVTKNDSTSFSDIEYSSHVEVGDIPDATTYVSLYYEESSPLGESRSRSFFDTDERVSKTGYVDNNTDGHVERGPSGFGPSLSLTALNCSKEFYLYNKSVKNAEDVDGNPFGDPVLLYTNMNNGFGCFGAYTATMQSKEIK